MLISSWTTLQVSLFFETPNVLPSRLSVCLTQVHCWEVVYVQLCTTSDCELCKLVLLQA